MNVLNILPLELSQQIHKYYFENVLLQIKTKRCFKTFFSFTTPYTLPIKCAMNPTPYSAFCHHCVHNIGPPPW